MTLTMTKLRISGHEGGQDEEKEEGLTIIEIGIFSGNMWEMAVNDYKRYGRVENMAGTAFAYGMTTALAEYLLSRPFEKINNGLHVDIDIGEYPKQEIVKIMELNNELKKLERNLPGEDKKAKNESTRLMLSLRKEEQLTNLVEEYVSWTNELADGLQYDALEYMNEKAQITLEG